MSKADKIKLVDELISRVISGLPDNWTDGYVYENTEGLTEYDQVNYFKIEMIVIS